MNNEEGAIKSVLWMIWDVIGNQSISQLLNGMDEKCINCWKMEENNNQSIN